MIIKLNKNNVLTSINKNNKSIYENSEIFSEIKEKGNSEICLNNLHGLNNNNNSKVKTNNFIYNKNLN